MPTKSYIRRYLADKKDHSHRYHIVRSSLDQCRRVPFGKWTKRVTADRDVLLDFCATTPVEIYLKSRFDKDVKRTKRLNNHLPSLLPENDYRGHYAHLGWYFLDDRGKKVPCCSGYEALFVVYLKWNKIPFEYEKWAIAHTTTMAARHRHWFGKHAHEGKEWKYWISNFAYIPDFYLPATNELIELKGWQPQWRNQTKAMRYLKRKGYRIRVLEWKHLRRLLGISVSYDTCFNRAKKDFSRPSRAFADPHWVKERLSTSVDNL